jgi:16S rRNA (cytosine1402-N4)-methyltransferase
VKNFMTEQGGRRPSPSRHDPRSMIAAAPSRFRVVTARAVRPGDAETAANPRARSSRLRALECVSSDLSGGAFA